MTSYIGITGHQKLDDPKAWPWVEEQLNNVVIECKSHLVGISSLAIGADQLFANIVLNHGGELYVVLPFENYEEKFEGAKAQAEYNRILSRATTVEILTRTGNDEEAYLAAGKRVVDISTLMSAVWNGKKAAGLGGTGDIVEYTKGVGKEVIHINPVLREVHRLI
jgi:hypothetical protein